MKTIIVWHLSRDLAVAQGLASDTDHIRPFTGALFGEKEYVQVLWQARCYEPVARVQVADSMHEEASLELAFQHTNHIHTPWNAFNCTPFVKPLHNEGNRSTSVGDVFQIVDADTKTSKTMMVSAFGFTNL